MIYFLYRSLTNCTNYINVFIIDMNRANNLIVSILQVSQNIDVHN